MRTTVTLAPDVSAALVQLQRQTGWRISAALNELIRRGLAAPEVREPFRQRTHDLGLRVDVRNVAEALDALDGPSER